MLTMVHIREIVQPAAYIACFALIAAIVRPFRVYFRRSVVLLATFVSIALVYSLWQRSVVGLVGDIVQTHRTELASIIMTSPFRELVTTSAPVTAS